MAFNLTAMGDKLARYRSQFQYSLADVASSTGISEDSLQEIEQGRKRPSGDEILILADFYKCDYKFFLSNEKLASFEQTETLFRRFGQEFSKRDRWAVQECMYLAECEDYIEKQLNKRPVKRFSFVKVGDFFKGHGKQAASALRRHLGYASNEVSMNIYSDMRNIGIRVFRRRLENSNISGLYIKHPVAGKCVLVNYSEDVYRQRFTAAHETAHTILDDEEDVLVSFAWDKSDLKEVRANAFASAYLIPPETISLLPNIGSWTEDKTIEWANKFKVSTHALAIALLENKIIDKSEYAAVSRARIPKKYKEDPELPSSLPPRSIERKKMLLEHGLSDDYVSLCFEAYRAHHISGSRLVEMLLLDSDVQLLEMAH
jgi:Zn-dependent peptidase ImmA (M78 family)/DNA-binding XRE family transcriptional regulator